MDKGALEPNLVKDWAESLGWRYDSSCNWYAIDLHEDGGGPKTTVLNPKAMELFYKSHLQTKKKAAAAVSATTRAIMSAKIEASRWPITKATLQNWLKVIDGQLQSATKNIMEE